MKNFKNGVATVSLLVVAAVVLVAAIGAGVFYYSKNNGVSKSAQLGTSTMVATSTQVAFDDSDLKVSFVRVPASENSLAGWNQIKSDAISKSDNDFLTKYFTSFDPANLPAFGDGTRIINNYQNKKLLKIFDAQSNYAYQCSLTMGDVCNSFNIIRSTAKLAALSAVVSFEQKKYADATAEAQKVVMTGQKMTAHADDVITLLIGWMIQKSGYAILNEVQSKQHGVSMAPEEKARLIANLREENKNVFKIMYSGEAETIDYITSPANKPAYVLSLDEGLIATYRKGAASSLSAWNPQETKKYFYDSYKITLSNLDKPCGSELATSTLDIGFSPANTSDENYVGKVLYTTTYAGLDGVQKKRCEIESLIQSL